mmetsp:Transcript_57284/g.153384  ORF Transcript_57284/g.153384 Transcript_57284/m.153384 type:complete len:235 (-) Transcript_57284:388-1092(-)
MQVMLTGTEVQRSVTMSVLKRGVSTQLQQELHHLVAPRLVAKILRRIAEPKHGRVQGRLEPRLGHPDVSGSRSLNGARILASLAASRADEVVHNVQMSASNSSVHRRIAKSVVAVEVCANVLRKLAKQLQVAFGAGQRCTGRTLCIDFRRVCPKSQQGCHHLQASSPASDCQCCLLGVGDRRINSSAQLAQEKEAPAHVVRADGVDEIRMSWIQDFLWCLLHSPHWLSSIPLPQ